MSRRPSRAIWKRDSRVLSLILVALLLDGTAVWSPRVAAAPAPALRIVDAAGNTPVVNEGGRIALRVVDGSGSPVSVSSWSSDNRAVGRVKRTNGLLRGKAFGFATVTAQTSQGPVSGFVVCARVRRQGGAMTQGDTKTDTGGNVYLSSPTRHVLYKATAASADVFAGQSGVSGYQEGTGGGVRFNGPAGIGVDNRAEGGLYVADTANHCIRKVDFRGRSSLAAGTPGFEGTMFGDETPISEAVLNGPRGVASVGANLYLTDTGNHCVWYVDVQRQRVQLVAGEPGEAGNANGEGRVARFDSPSGIAVNTRGNLLAVADTGNNVVRLIAIAPRGDGDGVIGQVTTLGLGSSARNARILEKLGDDRGTDQITFDQPISVSFDGVDNVYVIDNLTANVVTRPSAASGRPVERVDLAQVGTLGDPASVTVRRTQAFVLDEAATTEATAVNVVEVGAPMIRSVTPDTSRLEGGQQVTITGTNFAPESMLTLGDAEVMNYSVDSSTRIAFTVPAQQAPGGRTLTVLTRGGVAQVKFSVVPKSLEELAPGVITTIVGGVAFLGDGGPGFKAKLALPQGIAIDAQGNLFIADRENCRIRRLDAQTQRITTVAGTGIRGFDGDDGPAATARLEFPEAVAVDASGSLFLSDTFNHRVRLVDAVTGQIRTVVGNGTAGSSGDGGPASQASLYYPTGMSFDAEGNLYIADAGSNRVRRVDARSGIISTVAGTGEPSFDGDDKPATSAALWAPRSVAIDRTGGLLIADSRNNRVRRVDLITGTIVTVAGTGIAGYDGDGRQAVQSTLNKPTCVAIDSDDNLLICDSFNGRIRLVQKSSGRIRTIAGSGEPGFPTYDGDGKPAQSARLYGPIGVVSDAGGNTYLADSNNDRIRRVDIETGLISTVAGTGGVALDNAPTTPLDVDLFEPSGIAIARSGDVFVSDTFHHRVLYYRRASNRVSTVAGTGIRGYDGDGKPATSARLQYPRELLLTGDDELLIADSGNSRVRKVDLDTGSISTIAGSGNHTYDGDDKPATQAALGGPVGLALDAERNLFIADQNHNRVRRVDGRTGRITTIVGTGQAGFNGDDQPAAQAELNRPADVTVDEDGNLYIADEYNNRIRFVSATTGMIGTIAGTGVSDFGGDGQPALTAWLRLPSSVLVEQSGRVSIADTMNHRIRRIALPSGIITTLAGRGVPGYSGDDESSIDSLLNHPMALSIDDDKDIYFCDVGNDTVRVIKGAGASSSEEQGLRGSAPLRRGV